MTVNFFGGTGCVRDCMGFSFFQRGMGFGPTPHGKRAKSHCGRLDGHHAKWLFHTGLEDVPPASQESRIGTLTNRQNVLD